MKAFSLRVHFLGTNGWYDTVTGNTVCIALDHRDFVLVLDAGNGIQRLDSISVGDRPVFIFLSHLHLDHVCGLHIL
ncbi:MAG: hypothetical protein MUO52_16765, partial [Desulfobacterales bacterium]|nr:hypothetical protein [Desulfobacterales bacterium]